ncbi:peptidoglycan DD-metalloendopeptidase family protein [Jeotgalibacillus marinus]|uniref:M23 family metallopeptidase n=1 Tax=Jeotgalibacillus marinus TaxID=86667 RepID=A0ABV3Q216_9BACL
MNNDKQVNQKRFICTYTSKIVKTFVVGTLLSAIVLVNGAEASSEKEEELTEMNHVYAGEEYVGAVSDQSSIQEWVKEQEKDIKKKFDVSNLSSLENDITMIPEKVFNPNTRDEEVLSMIQEKASFQTEAKAVELNGKRVAYLSSDEEVEEMLRQIKLSAVSEEELETFEKQSTSNLKIDETRITEITVEGYEDAEYALIDPANLTTPEEAAKLLLKGQKQEVSYRIAEEDTIESITEEHNMKIEELLKLNPDLLEDDELTPKEELKVKKHIAGFSVNVEKEQRVKEAIQFDEEIVEDDELLKGDTKVKKKGKNGERVYTLQTSEKNGEQVSESKADEKVTKDPRDQIVEVGTKEIPSRGTGSFVWPTNGGYISSEQGPRWGKNHKGIDIARPDNYTINNVDNGTVVSAGLDGDYGNKVVVDHDNGLRTVYAHLSKIHVSPGQVVSQGDSLGIMGETGFATGIHLHFEVYSNGALVNPMDYL